MLTDEEIMAQVLAAFQEEQHEHRQSIAAILLDLERDPQHAQREALVTQLFREAHSLKGGARAAGLDAVEQLAHRMEDLFSGVRQNTLQLTPAVCDVIYATLEAIGALMSQPLPAQEMCLEPYQDILNALDKLFHTEPHVQPVENEQPKASIQVSPASSSTSSPQATNSCLVIPEPHAPPEDTRAPEEIPWEMTSSTVRLSTSILDNLMNETGELIISAVRTQQRARDARNLADVPARWRRIWRQTSPIITRLQKQPAGLLPTVHHLHDRDHTTIVPLSDRSAEARIQHDALVLMDALLQANSLLNELEQSLTSYARLAAEDSARLSAVTKRLQDQIRRTRMLPLSALFSPLRLQVREMVRIASKQFVLDIDDGNAEADRQVLESLREVLLHLLRNAIDHGIEPAEVRIARGKPPTGRLILRALVSGDYLDLTVEDDGAGLDIAGITQRALNDTLINETDRARVSEEELMNMIFLPGFSTRQKVDRLSGRGVGLDVVRSTIERMHGQVSVKSVFGAGCTFFLRVPISLTSSHGLLLRVGAATYMLPLESIQRIVPVTPDDIHIVEGRAALLIDGHPLILIHLADLLGSDSITSMGTAARSHTPAPGRWSLALLLGSGERQIACLVDGILGEQELVAHRLPAPLQRVRFIAGATILSDGKVVPILDVVDLLRAAIGTRSFLTLAPTPAQVDQCPTILIVDDSITTRTLEKNILESAGYRVHLATDGLEALHTLHTLVKNGGCDLLLSDIDMPNLNGFDLTTQVRNDPILKHLPVVLVTSLDSLSDRERGLAAGADAYIVKRSFDQQTLLDTIAQLI